MWGALEGQVRTLGAEKDFCQGCQSSTETSERSQYRRVSYPYGNRARQPLSNTILIQTHFGTSPQLLTISNNNQKSLLPLFFPSCSSHQQSASQLAPSLAAASKPFWKGATRQVPI